MGKTAHTPGPWHFSQTHLGAAFDIGAANGANIALVSGPKENGADEFTANARLIAVAPKLLSSLRDFVDNDLTPERNCSCHIAPPCGDCVEHSHRREMVDAARAVIAEVEGQS